jgi:ribonuclease P protein component
MDRLKRRADFLRVARGTRFGTSLLTIEIAPTPASIAAANRLRVGFTASKKVGNAVMRNRAKRRLRAAAAALLPLYGRPGHDYVLVARTATTTQPYSVLLKNIGEVLHRAHQKQRRSS